MENNTAELSLFNENELICNEEIFSFNETKKHKRQKRENQLKFNISHTIIVQESFDFGDEKNTIKSTPLLNNLYHLPNKKNININIEKEKEKDKDDNTEDLDLETNNSVDIDIDDSNNENEEFIDETTLDKDIQKDSTNAVLGLGNFFKEVNHYKLLTREEEHKYFIEYQQNKDPELKKFLISSNIKLVISVAKKISQRTKKITLEDMIDEGIIGLIKAIDKFEPDRNLKFSTYAFSWIQQSITRFIANTGDIIRVPVHFTDNMAKIKRFENNYMIENNIDTIDDKITSEALDIPLDKIKKYKKATQSMTSLDVSIDENDNTMIDVIEDKYSINPETSVLNTCLHDSLLKAVNSLDKREAFILINRFNLNHTTNPLTLTELAEKFKLTKERIRQIESSALQKLRHPMKSKEFREFY